MKLRRQSKISSVLSPCFLSVLILPPVPSPPPSFTCSDSGSDSPKLHLMHQLSGQDSSLALGRLEEWDISTPQHLDWNLCWWWLPLPSSDPSVASLLKRVLQHQTDYNLAVVTVSHSFCFTTHCPCFSSKDFWVTIPPTKDELLSFIKV